jgi:hypothetical protein
MRTDDARAAAALTGAGLYVVGGWLLVSHLFSVGIGAIDHSAPAAAAAPSCACLVATQRGHPGAAALKVVSVSVGDGPTNNCLVPAHLVSADAIVITRDEYQEFWRALGCT